MFLLKNHSFSRTCKTAGFFILLFVLFSCGAKKLEGTGAVTVKTHLLKDFEEITISNGWKAILMEGEMNKIVVKANENLHPFLQYGVKRGTLSLSSENTVGKADDKTILIYHTKEISAITASQNANIISNQLDQKGIEIHAEGGATVVLNIEMKNITALATDKARIRLSGSVKDLNAIARDKGVIEAQELTAENANVIASKNGNIYVTVEEEFNGEAQDGGVIEYYGNPEEVAIQKGAGASILMK